MATIPVLTVSQLTHAVKLCLENTFPMVWVQGEVSNFKLQSSGHLYFSLKDANAQVGAVMFRGNAANLATMPKDGDQVLVKGELNVYAPRGNYQIIVRELTPVGLGDLLLKLEQLKKKLQGLGWFAAERKKPLPKFPKRIGVVTSPTGAAIQDMLNILTRRAGGFHLILNPVRVQGEGAAKEIAQAIEQFNKYDLVDVLIVGRGGGSLEDLWAFNEEIVAEAIFKSHIPVISAVGHEIDFCIADFVADLRAPTPSAAAELVMGERRQLLDHLAKTRERLQQTVTHLIRHAKQRLQGLVRQPVLATPYAILGSWMQRLDSSRHDLDLLSRQGIQSRRLQLIAREKQLQALRPTTRLAHFQKELQARSKQLDFLIKRLIAMQRERLAKVTDTLHAIDPKNLLQKGYSLLLAEKDRSVITSIHAIKEHEKVRIVLFDGEAVGTISEKYERNS